VKEEKHALDHVFAAGKKKKKKRRRTGRKKKEGRMIVSIAMHALRPARKEKGKGRGVLHFRERNDCGGRKGVGLAHALRGKACLWRTRCLPLAGEKEREKKKEKIGVEPRHRLRLMNGIGARAGKGTKGSLRAASKEGEEKLQV